MEENKYCFPGTEYNCPYAQRCADEGKRSIFIVKRPLTSFNSKIKKHFTWNFSPESKQITCLLRVIINKDLPSLIEGFERCEDFENEEEGIIFYKR